MTDCRVINNLSIQYHYIMPLLAKLPQSLAYRLASLYGRLQLVTKQEEYALICAQMQQVFKEQEDAQLSAWANYHLCMRARDTLDTEFFQTLHSDQQVDAFVQLNHHEALLAARQKGRRVIITTGHFGRLWMAGIGLQRHGISVGTITRDKLTENAQNLPEVEFRYRAKKLKALQKRLRGPFLFEGDSIRPLYRALDQYVIALLIDVPYGQTQGGCVELPFLGQTCQFPLGIAKIARKTNALIFPYYVFECRKGLQVEFYPAIDAADLNDIEIMQQLVCLLEKQIMAHPEQWWLWSALPLLWQTNDG